MKLSPDRKIAGVLVPVFSLRTATDLGIGDTDGVRQMIDWCARHGFGVLQLLPINETSPDNSPYNAISALALDPTTIAVSPEHVPDLPAADFAKLASAELLAELRHGSVHYRKVKALKLQLLSAAFENFRSCQPADEVRVLNAFIAANGWVNDYALFRLLIELHGGNGNWESWPRTQQSPAAVREWLAQQPAAEREALQRRLDCFVYIQWLAHRQWHALRAHAERRGVALMGDIPFGVSRYSADVWANRELFDLKWSGGAPPEASFKPDLFTEKWGQNWGIPLYRWDAHRKTNFAWWRLRVQQISGIFHSFRIDHVLGFYRVFAFPWPPQENRKFEKLTPAEAQLQTSGLLPRFFPSADDTAKHKKINRAQGDELLRVILDAAGDTVVLAEDLGMVPDYVRPHLLELKIPGFKIPHWERNADYSFQDAAQYPRLSLVTPATHDHEPLASLWRKLWQDHEDARRVADHHRAHITWLELQRFVQWFGWDGHNIPREFTDDLHEAHTRRVLQSNSWFAIFMITDIFAQEARFNVPGPVAETNWSARLETTVAELDNQPSLSAKTKMFARLIAESHRKP